MEDIPLPQSFPDVVWQADYAFVDLVMAYCYFNQVNNFFIDWLIDWTKQSGKQRWKRWVFRRLRNVDRDWADVTFCGRPLHTRAAATLRTNCSQTANQRTSREFKPDMAMVWVDPWVGLSGIIDFFARAPGMITSLYMQRLWFVLPWLTHRYTRRQTTFCRFLC